MAEIHTLKHPLSPEEIYSSTASLSAMIGASVDLGPRGTEIRRLGEAIEREIAVLRSKLDGCYVAENVLHWIDRVEAIARDACKYEDAHRVRA